MIRKGVMVFPDIPILHGGKKGEWILLDSKGQK
jgi:midasin (ATPase involved in ribosome maturation)